MLSMRLPVKKIAAVVALLFGAGYLALSGGNVATIRAYIMVSVMFCAILLNRRALTLRAVAIAAIIVLTIQPESLTGPGFQMSFAATAALVAVFSALREMPNLSLPAPLKMLSAVVLSSFVAGLATAPFAAASFNQVAQYGLLANVVTVPLMGAIVMPAAVLAILLAPFGLQFVALEVMRWGVWWILKVAAWVSDLEGALQLVITPDGRAIPLLAMGGLFLILWRGKGRLLGLPLLMLGGLVWAQTTRPMILISDSGALVGVMTPAGRALNKAKGEGFVAGSWLENDGDAAEQQQAFARTGFKVERGRSTYSSAAYSLVQLSGKQAEPRIRAACETYDIVVTTIKADPIDGCILYDLLKLRETGSVAITHEHEIIGARTREGERLWSPRSSRAKR
jgi:competence protein ComEC